jgi:hypothetical protein
MITPLEAIGEAKTLSVFDAGSMRSRLRRQAADED